MWKRKTDWKKKLPMRGAYLGRIPCPLLPRYRARSWIAVASAGGAAALGIRGAGWARRESDGGGSGRRVAGGGVREGFGCAWQVSNTATHLPNVPPWRFRRMPFARRWGNLSWSED